MLCRWQKFFYNCWRVISDCIWVAVLCLYLGFRGDEANCFRCCSASRQGFNSFTKLLQLTVIPQPLLALVLVCPLCHFSAQSQRQKQLLTYALTDQLKSFAFPM